MYQIVVHYLPKQSVLSDRVLNQVRTKGYRSDLPRKLVQYLNNSSICPGRCTLPHRRPPGPAKRQVSHEILSETFKHPITAPSTMGRDSRPRNGSAVSDAEALGAAAVAAASGETSKRRKIVTPAPVRGPRPSAARAIDGDNLSGGGSSRPEKPPPRPTTPALPLTVHGSRTWNLVSRASKVASMLHTDCCICTLWLLVLQSMPSSAGASPHRRKI